MWGTHCVMCVRCTGVDNSSEVVLHSWRTSTHVTPPVVCVLARPGVALSHLHQMATGQLSFLSQSAVGGTLD